MNRVFHSLQDTTTPCWVSCVVVGMNIALNLILRIFLGANGLALATSIAGATGMAILLLALKKRFGHLGFGSIAPELVKIIIASLLCAGMCLAMNRLLPPVMGTGRVFVRLALCAGASLIVYGVTCWGMGVKALRELAGGVVRRRK